MSRTRYSLAWIVILASCYQSISFYHISLKHHRLLVVLCFHNILLWYCVMLIYYANTYLWIWYKFYACSYIYGIFMWPYLICYHIQSITYITNIGETRHIWIVLLIPWIYLDWLLFPWTYLDWLLLRNHWPLVGSDSPMRLLNTG